MRVSRSACSSSSSSSPVLGFCMSRRVLSHTRLTRDCFFSSGTFCPGATFCGCGSGSWSGFVEGESEGDVIVSLGEGTLLG
jgi:hypothetical protein